MALIWLQGWTGDQAGNVEGRQPNRLLIALSLSDGTFPTGWYLQGQLDGITDYPYIAVACLAPGSRYAMATAVDQAGYQGLVYSIKLAEVDFGAGDTPWVTGVNLFSVTLAMDGGNQASTIATALIDDNVQRITFTGGQTASLIRRRSFVLPSRGAPLTAAAGPPSGPLSSRIQRRKR